MFVLSSFHQMFIVLGMYNFDDITRSRFFCMLLPLYAATLLCKNHFFSWPHDPFVMVDWSKVGLNRTGQDRTPKFAGLWITTSLSLLKISIFILIRNYASGFNFAHECTIQAALQNSTTKQPTATAIAASVYLWLPTLRICVSITWQKK